jgi:4-hydroxy-3-methylbut-2-enyl diphosphate reductase
MQTNERSTSTLPAPPAAQTQRRIVLANPRGFCAGVERAIDTVDELLDIYGAPIYVRKEIVHNRDVVDGFRAKGVVFVAPSWCSARTAFRLKCGARRANAG